MKPLYNSNSVAINNKQLKELSMLSSWKSILAISSEWLIIAGCIVLHQLYPTLLVYLIVWVLISTRLYAMYSLIHEAIHYSITRNKKVNDLLGQMFLGFPLLISLSAMRKNHLDHHKYLQTDKDPEMKHLQYEEFHFPKTRFQLIKMALADITGINFMYYQLIRLLQFFQNKPGIKVQGLLIPFLYLAVAVLAFFSVFARDLLLYWLIPYATIYQLLNRVRLSTEHFNIDEKNPFKTRSVLPSWLEKWVLTPHNLGYHLDHHLYPGVPFYNLPKLHRMLLNDSEYKANAIVENSYTSVLKHFITPYVHSKN